MYGGMVVNDLDDIVEAWTQCDHFTGFFYIETKTVSKTEILNIYWPLEINISHYIP